MRKLKLQMQVSVDGFVAGPKGEMDWMVWDWDERLKDHVSALHEPVDSIVLGRVLAEGFIPAWADRIAKPESNTAIARKMVETPKVVFSKSIPESRWDNTIVATGDLVDEIGRLKAAPGGDIIAYGGGRFVSELIHHGLIDEFHFFVNPAAIGEGMTIFREPGRRIPLRLASTDSFDCGIVVLTYVPGAS